MAFKTFTSTTLSSSDVNSMLMRQTVIVCTSGTRPSSPNEGMCIYETDTDKRLIYTTATTGWQPPWNDPWGRVGGATVTANQTTISTITDLTGLAATWTAVANRRYRVSACGLVLSTVAGDLADITLTDASNTKLQTIGAVECETANGRSWGQGFYENSGSVSGSTTWKMRGSRSSGSGTLTIVASATAPAYIVIDDVGPLSAPA